MAIKLDCPRCKKPLSVPNKKAGGYATCPRCNGNFWVPADGVQEPSEAVPQPTPSGGPVPATPPDVPVATGPGDPPPAAPPNPTSMTNPQSVALPSPPPPPSDGTLNEEGSGRTQTTPSWNATPMVTSPGVRTPSPKTPRPTRPGPPRKVAQFITAEAARSSLRPTPDGKLPELSLQEGQNVRTTEPKSGAGNPLVRLGLLSWIVVASIAVLLVDFQPRDTTKDRRRGDARVVIEENFFAGVNTTSLEPYQEYLREAQRAFARGDRKTERQMYRKVLNMLRVERGTFEKGLTGSPSLDKELEEQISILLSED